MQWYHQCHLSSLYSTSIGWNFLIFFCSSSILCITQRTTWGFFGLFFVFSKCWTTILQCRGGCRISRRPGASQGRAAAPFPTLPSVPDSGSSVCAFHAAGRNPHDTREHTPHQQRPRTNHAKNQLMDFESEMLFIIKLCQKYSNKYRKIINKRRSPRYMYNNSTKLWPNSSSSHLKLPIIFHYTISV